MNQHLTQPDGLPAGVALVRENESLTDGDPHQTYTVGEGFLVVKTYAERGRANWVTKVQAVKSFDGQNWDARQTVKRFRGVQIDRAIQWAIHATIDAAEDIGVQTS
tara:strand:+ start:1046 stop:1363 length:318 start_codon:yes stop_codon:yes gene_type:complete